MYDAHSLQGIISTISNELPRKVTVIKREPSETIGFVTTCQSSSPTRYKTIEIEETRDTKLVGILLCHPNSPLGKEEILPHLSHFHMRSGEAVDFFCVGYGAFWPDNHFADQNVVAKIDGTNWLFSEKAYSSVIDELEADTAWQYSGETELILLTAYKSNTGNVSFDYNTAIVCNLETMHNDNAFSSVRAFFENIFKYAKQQSTSDSTWGLSDNMGVQVMKTTLLNSVLSLLPEKLKEAYKGANHYAIRNINSKKL